MDPETTSQTAIIDETSARKVKAALVINAIAFIVAFVGHVVTILFGVPMFGNCFYVALVVMIMGSVLGLIQQVPEFLRNFCKLEPETRRYVNYFYLFIIVLRIFWLITATVVIATANCDDIIKAWICIYVNWGILGLIVTIILIVIIVRILKRRSESFR